MNAHGSQFSRVTSCPHSVLYEQGIEQNSSCAWAKILFLAPRWGHSRAPEEQTLSSAAISSTGGRSRSCSFFLPRTRGANLAGKSVYRCPKNYPIKGEFGMWFHVDHLLLKSCSNTVKSLGNNWTNILELVKQPWTCQILWRDLWRS